MADFSAAHAQHQAAPWVEWLARIGYAAKGIVYILVGWIALDAAIGGGQSTGSRGALQSVADEPFGQVLLALVAVGLLGYAIWRFVEAALDPEDKGSGAGGIARRLGYAVSGVIHAALALYAAQLVFGSGGGSSGGGSGTDSRTAMLMQQPFGRWLVGLVGLGIVGYGLYELYRAWTLDFGKRLKTSEMSSTTREWTTRAGRAGLAARGVVFGIIGIFLVQAALQYDPQQARGLGGALRALQEQAYGPWLLGAVALGLIGYGLFQLVRARYRRIEPGPG